MDKYTESEKRLLSVIDNLKLTKQERQILELDIINLKEYGSNNVHNTK